MHPAETRIPAGLVTDPGVTYTAFRLWCWLDHQCQVHGGEVVTNSTQVSHQTGIYFGTVKNLLRDLAAAGWLTVETVQTGTGALGGYLVGTVHDPDM